MANLNADSMNKLSIVSTVIDAAMAFARGNRLGGALLLGAAVLSSKVPGLGVATSIAMRLYRRFR